MQPQVCPDTLWTDVRGGKAPSLVLEAFLKLKIERLQRLFGED